MLAAFLKLGSCFVGSFVITTLLIRCGIPKLNNDAPAQKRPAEPRPAGPIFDFRATGLWIGLCETLMVFSFVYEREYGALAIIVGAKEFVRKENIQQNPSYYLLGTLINVTIALVLAQLAREWVLAG